MENEEVRLLPSQVEYLLVTAITKRLMDRYAPTFGEKSNFIAVAILNRAFLMEPGGEAAIRFREVHADLIEREAHEIWKDSVMEMAFSLLYALLLIRIGPTNYVRTRALAETATELNIELRTSEEFYNTSAPWKFLAYVQRQATNLLGYTRPEESQRS